MLTILPVDFLYITYFLSLSFFKNYLDPSWESGHSRIVSVSDPNGLGVFGPFLDKFISKGSTYCYFPSKWL